MTHHHFRLSLALFASFYFFGLHLVLLVLLGVIYRYLSLEFSLLSVLHNIRRLSCIHLDNSRLCNESDQRLA